LESIVGKESKCYSDFYKYVKRRKGNEENILAIKVSIRRFITGAIEKANTFNSYYSTVFSSDGNILHIQGESRGDPFTADIKAIKAIAKTNLYDQTGSLEKCLNWVGKP